MHSSHKTDTEAETSLFQQGGTQEEVSRGLAVDQSGDSLEQKSTLQPQTDCGDLLAKLYTRYAPPPPSSFPPFGGLSMIVSETLLRGVGAI